jgi:hypothetical protein
MRLDKEELGYRLQEWRNRWEALPKRTRLILGVGVPAGAVMLLLLAIVWWPRGGAAPIPRTEALETARQVAPRLQDDPRFATIQVISIPPTAEAPDGKLLVRGSVETEDDLEDLRGLIVGRSPNIRIEWQVGVHASDP